MSHETAVLALQPEPAPSSVLRIGDHIAGWVLPRAAGNSNLLAFWGSGAQSCYGKHSSWKEEEPREMGAGSMELLTAWKFTEREGDGQGESCKGKQLDLPLPQFLLQLKKK